MSKILLFYSFYKNNHAGTLSNIYSFAILACANICD